MSTWTEWKNEFIKQVALGGETSAEANQNLSVAGQVTAVSNGLDNRFAQSGGLYNRLSMPWLGKKISSIKSGSTSRVKWLYFGDSYGNKIVTQVQGILENSFGKAAGYGAGGTLGAQITINSTSGTVTSNVADFTLWPTGQTATLGSAGASMTFGVGGVSFTCDTIKVIHANTGGSFKIQVDGVDNTTPTVTSNNSITITTISVSRAAHTVSVVQTAGSPKIVGITMEDSTLSGAYFIAAYQGGISLSSATTQAWTNWSTFLADIQPDVITFEMKETASTLSVSLDSFLTATQAGWTSCDVVLIQSPPQATDDTDLVAQNTIIRARATSYNVLTWDSYTPFGSYTKLTALGWNGDGTHVANDADLYRGMLMLRDFGILETARFEPLDVSAANGYFSSQVTLGTTAGANGKLAVITTDMAIDLARSVQFRSAGGTTFCTLDSRNNSGNASTLPQYSTFGSGNGGIVGASAIEVSARQASGGNLNNKAYFSALAFIPTKASQTLSTNGAITFNCANGQTQRVALQANATSSSITGTFTDGVSLTIQWAQDSTGGRTYSWPGNCRFVGGTAPTDTTADTMTTVNFIFDNTASRWIETSRAVAVPTT